jgi:hypothetical protein
MGILEIEHWAADSVMTDWQEGPFQVPQAKLGSIDNVF